MQANTSCFGMGRDIKSSYNVPDMLPGYGEYDVNFETFKATVLWLKPEIDKSMMVFVLKLLKAFNNFKLSDWFTNSVRSLVSGQWHDLRSPGRTGRFSPGFNDRIITEITAIYLNERDPLLNVVLSFSIPANINNWTWRYFGDHVAQNNHRSELL